MGVVKFKILEDVFYTCSFKDQVIGLQVREENKISKLTNTELKRMLQVARDWVWVLTSTTEKEKDVRIRLLASSLRWRKFSAYSIYKTGGDHPFISFFNLLVDFSLGDTQSYNDLVNSIKYDLNLGLFWLVVC